MRRNEVQFSTNRDTYLPQPACVHYVVVMDTIDPLSPDSCAQFFGVIDQTRDGLWRAVATSHNPEAKAAEEQYLAIETFSSEEAAYNWLKQEAIARGFRNIQITTRVGTK